MKSIIMFCLIWESIFFYIIIDILMIYSHNAYYNNAKINLIAVMWKNADV